MKQNKYTRLWLTMILMFSCLGVIYITTNSFAANSKETSTAESPLPSESTLLTNESNSSLSVDSRNSAVIHPQLSHFADSAVLKVMPNQEALALLVSQANLQPLDGNRLQPTAEVSRIEFLTLALHWLHNYQSNASIPSAISTTSHTDKNTVSGTAITLDRLASLGFTFQASTLVHAAGYGIPLFSEHPDDYSKSISYGEAAAVLIALSEAGLTQKTIANTDLENYIPNAYSLRLHPYHTAITKAFSLGIFAVEELPSFAPELPVNRSHTANMLTRLFLTEQRVNNPHLPREALSDNRLDYYSKAVFLFNNNTKRSVFSFNENQRLSPASLTKIMTVYLALEHIPDIKAKVPVSAAFRKRMLRSGASIAGFYGNEKVSYEDLLHATLLASGAEAAGTLAIQIAGKESAFIEQMNQKAAELGMKNTHFKTVEGLDADGQYTTAKDMAILLEAALNNPKFYQIACTSRFVTSKTRIHPKGITLRSTILKNISPEEERNFHILGGKSGTTRQAGLCWATFAEKNGNTYILITMGAPLDNIHNPTMYQKKDAIKIYQRISNTPAVNK